jgi:hypothetical protein
MDIRPALKGQYHGALLMLKEAIEQCPDPIWVVVGDPRASWRIAYHALYFADLYLQARESDFSGWTEARKNAESLWGDAPDIEPYTKAEVLAYWAIVDRMVDGQIDSLDLDSQETGFHWYTMPKLDHVIMNIRHIQEHAGQLRERVIQSGGDPRWIGQA